MNDQNAYTGPMVTLLTFLGLSFLIPLGLSGRAGAPQVEGQSPPPAASAAAASSGDGEGDDVRGDHHILRPLIQFLGPAFIPPGGGGPGPEGRGGPATEGTEPSVTQLREALEGDGFGGRGWDPQFMIVTVPDPVDSASGERLDLLLDTLQSALKLDRFVLDRYRLPWVEYQERVRSGGAPPSDRWYAREPGLLLFRDGRPRREGSAAPYRLLMVFLVGETPVSGLHKDAFVRGVRLIRELGGAPVGRCDGEEAPSIPVLGPYFSGSADSLIEAILAAERASGRRLRFDVITGSATNVNKVRLESLAERDGDDVHFDATVVPDALLKQELIRYISGHNQGVTTIAWLTESNTGYGGYASRPPPTPVDHEAREGGTPGARHRIIEYPFPLHISRLRATYEAQQDEARDRNPLEVRDRARLDIPLDVNTTARDTLPSIAPGLTTAYAELILADIFRSIREQGIRYVGITATDTRDVVFLAESLRDHCPNTQLLIISSDLSYVHPSHRPDFQGALIGSPYPLFPMVQSWTPSGTIEAIRRMSTCERNGLRAKRWSVGEREFWEAFRAAAERHAREAPDAVATRQFVSFSSGSQQGFYNAALALRRNHKLRLWEATLPGGGEHLRPCPTRAALEREIVGLGLLGYGIPFESSVPNPPIWISVVGNDGFWPVEYHPYREVAKRYEAAARAAGEDPSLIRSRDEYVYHPLYNFINELFPEPEPGRNELEELADREKRQQTISLRRAPFDYDHASLLLIVALVLFGFINVAFYFLRIDWGPASCFDRERLAKLPRERIYLAACVVPLWMLLTGLALLAIIPIAADARFNLWPDLSLPTRAGVVGLRWSHAALFIAFYAVLITLAIWGASAWLSLYLTKQTRDLRQAKRELRREGGWLDVDDELREDRRQHFRNIRCMWSLNRAVDNILGALLVAAVVLVVVAVVLALVGGGDGDGAGSSTRLRGIVNCVVAAWLILGVVLARMALDWSEAAPLDRARRYLRRVRRPRRRRVLGMPVPGRRGTPGAFARWRGLPVLAAGLMVAGLFLAFLLTRVTPPSWLICVLVWFSSSLAAAGLMAIILECRPLRRRRGGEAGRRRMEPPMTLLGRGGVVQVVVLLVLVLAVLVGGVLPRPVDDAGMQAEDLQGFGHLVLVFERSVHLYSGVSLLTMAIFLSLALYAWGFTQLYRLYLFHYFYPLFGRPDVALVPFPGDLARDLPAEGSNLVVVADVQHQGLDLRLIPPARRRRAMPRRGANLVVVASIGGVFRFRLFDGNGAIVEDRDESSLPDQDALRCLKQRLGGVWLARDLTDHERRVVIADVMALLGRDRPTLLVRSFDKEGHRYPDRTEQDLHDAGRKLARLKATLAGLWRKPRLTRNEKELILSAVGPLLAPRHRSELEDPAAAAPMAEEAGGPEDTGAEGQALRWRQAEATKLQRSWMRLDHLLERPTRTIVEHAGIWLALASLLSLCWIARLGVNSVPPFEHPVVSLLVWIGLGVFLLLWTHWLINLLMLMKFVRKILAQFALLPMQSAFARLPRPIASLMGRLLYSERPRLSLCRIPVHYLEQIAREYRFLAESAPPANWSGIMGRAGAHGSDFDRVSEEFAERSLLTPSPAGGIFASQQVGQRARAFTETQEYLARASRLLWRGLIREWSTRDARAAYPPAGAEASQEAGPPPRGDGPAAPAEGGEGPTDDRGKDARGASGRVASWVGLVEEFMAIQITIYLSQLFFQARNLLYGLLAGSLLMLVAVLSYPLQPHELLVSSTMVMVLAVAVVGVMIFVQMERDPLVTRITGKRSSGVQLDLQFLTSIAPFVLPLVLILISRVFPDAWRWISSTIDPMLRAAL